MSFMEFIGYFYCFFYSNSPNRPPFIFQELFFFMQPASLLIVKFQQCIHKICNYLIQVNSYLHLFLLKEITDYLKYSYQYPKNLSYAKTRMKIIINRMIIRAGLPWPFFILILGQFPDCF